MTSELWTPIEGFENYAISTHGRVLSSYKEDFKVLHIGNSGYYQVQLYRNNKLYNKYVHRLVAKAFIPNPENLTTVNHKNSNRLDNHWYNLEWCTQLTNARLGMKNRNQSGIKNHQATYSNEIRTKILDLRQKGWRNRDIAKYLNVSQGYVGSYIHYTLKKRKY